MSGFRNVVAVFFLTVFVSAYGIGKSEGAGLESKNVDSWWAEIEYCVKEKETVKKRSEDSHIDSWMYDDWEEECVKNNPYSTDPSVQDYVERMEIKDAAELELNVSDYDASSFNTSIDGRVNVVALRGRLDIVSLSDHAEIQGLQVNRGNCGYKQNLKSDVKFPIKLEYAQSVKIYLLCKGSSVREVTVEANGYKQDYSFFQ